MRKLLFIIIGVVLLCLVLYLIFRNKKSDIVTHDEVEKNQDDTKNSVTINTDKKGDIIILANGSKFHAIYGDGNQVPTGTRYIDAQTSVEMYESDFEKALIAASDVRIPSITTSVEKKLNLFYADPTIATLQSKITSDPRLDTSNRAFLLNKLKTDLQKFADNGTLIGLV